MDIAPRLFPVWNDLKQYCYLVASTVGLLSLPIIGLARGADPDVAASYAVRLGIALQLTNILRDVGDDVDSGRIYLPLADLSRFGLSERDIRQKSVDERFVGLMHFEIQRARALYREAIPGIALLRSSVRPAVGAAAILYRAILDEIEANDYNVFSRRAHLSTGKKLWLLPGIFFAIRRLRAPAEALPE